MKAVLLKDSPIRSASTLLTRRILELKPDNTKPTDIQMFKYVVQPITTV
jgi:hypothetical protein